MLRIKYLYWLFVKLHVQVKLNESYNLLIQILWYVNDKILYIGAINKGKRMFHVIFLVCK